MGRSIGGSWHCVLMTNRTHDFRVILGQPLYLVGCELDPAPGNLIRVLQKPLQVGLLSPKTSPYIPISTVKEPVYRLIDLVLNIYLLAIQICGNWVSDQTV